ncbi:MAG: polysaccharide biosynthesis C-terminal domain-containing protein, partial [Acetobacteraceae bacterium]
RAFEREGPEAARSQALSNAEILVAVALPAWGGFTVAAQHIAVVIVGPDYSAKAAQLMPLIGFAILLHAMRAHYFAHALHLTGNTVGLLLGALPAALVNVALNLWLMPSFGLVGAAWASIIAYSLALLVSVWQARRQFAMPFPLRETCKAAGATGMMCLVLHALHFPTTAAGLLGLIATGGAAYLAMVAAFDIGGLRSKAMILRRRLTVRPVG